MTRILSLISVILVMGCGPEGPPDDGPYEIYHENGELSYKGTYKDDEECGEWIEDGETVTYDPY